MPERSALESRRSSRGGRRRAPASSRSLGARTIRGLLQRNGTVVLAPVLLATLISGASAAREILTCKPDGLMTLAWVLALTSTLASILGMVFVVAYRSNKIVQAGQPFFLWLICLGALLQSSCLYFDAGSIEEIPDITWKVLDKLCITQLWLFYLGMLTVLVSLICKLWRAEKACKFRRGQRILVQHVIWPFAAIIVFELALVTVATTVYPPYWQEVMMDPFDDTKNMSNNNSTANLMAIIGNDAMNGTASLEEMLLDEDKMKILEEMMLPMCFYKPVPAMDALRAISHFLLIVAQLLVLWMGYQTRDISDDLVDTDLVLYMILSWLTVYIPFMLLEYGVIPSGKVYHYLELILPFLVSMLALGFLIVPKVYYVFYEKRNGKYPERSRRLSSWSSNPTSIVSANGRIRVSGLDPPVKGTAAAVAAAAHGLSMLDQSDRSTEKTKPEKNLHVAEGDSDPAGKPKPEATIDQDRDSSHPESTTRRDSLLEDSFNFSTAAPHN